MYIIESIELFVIRIKSVKKLKLVPSHITDLIQITNLSNYNLRSVTNENIILVYLKPKTNFLKQTFSYSCIKTWNEVKLLNSKSLTTFKKSMKVYIFINQNVIK